MMRPVENYSAWSDELVREHGPRMAQLLGQDDFLDSPKGADYSNWNRHSITQSASWDTLRRASLLG